jgi:hypothetical protein
MEMIDMEAETQLQAIVLALQVTKIKRNAEKNGK